MKLWILNYHKNYIMWCFMWRKRVFLSSNQLRKPPPSADFKVMSITGLIAYTTLQQILTPNLNLSIVLVEHPDRYLSQLDPFMIFLTSELNPRRLYLKGDHVIELTNEIGCVCRFCTLIVWEKKIMRHKHVAWAQFTTYIYFQPMDLYLYCYTGHQVTPNIIWLQ